MYYEEEGGALHFLVGLAVGALLGAGVALLTAPQTGKRTRRKIVRATEDLTEATGERLQDVAGEVRKVADEARRAAGRSSTRLRDRIGRS